jgi:hypothetical protein
MSKYFFDLHGLPESHRDKHGTELPDDNAALAYAERVVRELKVAGGYNVPGLAMVVRDTNGKTILSVPF